VRPDYLNAVWNVVNFNDVAKRLVRADAQRGGMRPLRLDDATSIARTLPPFLLSTRPSQSAAQGK
jgi:hypothetical protein